MAGGIGDYGSDESEDDERSVRGSESSDTDEEELHLRIREKQEAFRRKEREIQQQLDKQEQEALLARGKFTSFKAGPTVLRFNALYILYSYMHLQVSLGEMITPILLSKYVLA